LKMVQNQQVNIFMCVMLDIVDLDLPLI
jgi:hypothetical protein